MKKVIRCKRKKYVLVIAILCFALSSFAVATYQNNKQDEFNRIEVTETEKTEIQETISGAYATMNMLGAFVSTDGTTAMMSESEIDALIDGYNEKVDRYYAKDAYEYTAYKVMNEEYLKNAFKNPAEIFNVIDGGVRSCEIQSIKMEKDGESAIVDSSIVKWSNAISSWLSPDSEPQNTTFIVTPSVGKFHVTNKVIKEDGVWKILETDEYTPIESGYTRNLRNHVLKNYDIDKNSTMTSDEGYIYQITDEEADAILQRLSTSKDYNIKKSASAIRENIAVYEMTFSSFEDAFKVANSLDVSNGNYYALEEALNQQR